MSDLLIEKENGNETLYENTHSVVDAFLLLGTMPAFAVERPFALKGTGVATLIIDDAGHLIGAIPTGSGTATHLGQ